MDLSALYGRHEESDPRGNQSFHPAMMLKILIRVCDGDVLVTKDRAEDRKGVAFRVLAAGTSRSIGRSAIFRQEHLQKFVALFKQVVLIVKSSGLTKLGRVAIDGTKVKAMQAGTKR